jgi:hypothetical protein
LERCCQAVGMNFPRKCRVTDDEGYACGEGRLSRLAGQISDSAILPNEPCQLPHISVFESARAVQTADEDALRKLQTSPRIAV